MKTRVFLYLMTSLFIFSCNNSTPFDNGNPYDVNFKVDISNTESISLSKLGTKLEYIFLETSKETLLGKISDISIVDSFLFVTDSYRLMQFDKNGKFIKLVGSQGRGPGEYNKIWDFVVDEKEKEIFILSSGRKIITYDFNGKYIRDFNLGFPSMQFVLSERGELVLHQINISQDSAESIFSLHFLDKNGKTKMKIPNTARRVNGGISIPYTPLYSNEGFIYFMEFGNDTLYRFDKYEKKPQAIFHFGDLKFPIDPTIDEIQTNNENLEAKFYINKIRESSNLLFIDLWYIFPHISETNCIYDKSLSKLTILSDNGFTNDIDGGISFWPKYISDGGLLIDYAEAYDLKSWCNEPLHIDNISSQLKTKVTSLSETSNPIIMILYP